MLREVLKGLDEFENRYVQYDVVWLLEHAKLIASSVDVKSVNVYATIHRMMKSLYLYKQGQYEKNDKYAKDLDQLIKTVKLSGGNLLYRPSLVHIMTLTVMRGVKVSEATEADR